MTVVIITIIIGHITMIVLMLIIAIYLYVVPMKRAAEAAGKAEVLSLAQRLERVTAQSARLSRAHSQAEEADDGSDSSNKYAAHAPAVVYIRDPIFSRR